MVQLVRVASKAAKLRASRHMLPCMQANPWSVPKPVELAYLCWVGGLGRAALFNRLESENSISSTTHTVSSE